MKMIHKTSMRLGFLIISMVWMVGCNGGQVARDVALETSAKLTSYEKQVNAKVTAEKTFYQNEADEIRRFLTGKVDLGSLPGEVTTVDNIEKSLLYGKIVNSAHKEARLLSESMINSNKVDVLGKTMLFVRKGVENDMALYREISDRQVRLRESFLKELVKIDQQKARLKKVKKGLTKLSDSEEDEPNFKLIKGYAEVILKAVDSMDDQ
jgi:hypothetical protein